MEENNNIIDDLVDQNYDEEFLEDEEFSHTTGDNKRLFTIDEVEAIKRELQRNSEKGIQKLIFEKKLLKESLKELAYIGQRSERLLEIADENPSLANVILSEFFEESLEEYKERIGYIDDYKNPELMKRKIEREAERIARDKIIFLEKQRFISNLRMNDDERNRFEDALNEIIRSSCIDLDNLDEIFERAYRVGNMDFDLIKGLENQEILGKIMTVAGARSSGNNINNSGGGYKVRKDVEEFFKKYKL